jgi:dolichol-phosphate mannosyltransferase
VQCQYIAPGCIPLDVRSDLDISLDIIVPIYNESEVIPILLKRLDDVFSRENRQGHHLKQVRYLFVDDGSRDNSAALLEELGGRQNPMQLIVFTRNFGHQAAVNAGIAFCDADVTAIIDADLQDPPELLLDMVALWRRGAEMVYGQRATRKGSLVKKMCYLVFYRLYRFLSSVEVPLDSGDFGLMGRPVIGALKMLPERLRFVRGLRAWVGYDTACLEYHRPERARGETKYTFRKLYHLATEGIASMSIMPLRLSQLSALVLFVLSLAMLVIGLPGWLADKSWMMPAMLFANGIILFCLYVLGSYLGRMYLEVKGRPTFIVKEVIDRAPH